MKTALIITQRFYPDPVVGGVRMTQWAKLLPRYGWTPIIACRNFGFGLNREEISSVFHPDTAIVHLNDQPVVSIARERGQELRAAAAKVLGPGMVGRVPRNPLLKYAKAIATKVMASRVRAEDAAFWRRSYPRIADLVRQHRPDVVITSSPPVAIHHLGHALKREFPGIRWLADFRDPYRQGERYRVDGLQAIWSYRELQDEAAIYRGADLITCATPTQQRWIRRRFGADSHKAVTVLNGVPEELIAALSSASVVHRDACAKVVGFSDAVEAVTLAQAIATMNDATLKLKFVGKPPLAQDEIGGILGDRAVFAGAVRHDLALAEIASAKVLIAVLSERRSRTPAVASKLFEYLAVPAPVIVLNPSTTARTLFGQLAGVWMLARPTVGDIQAALEAAMAAPQQDLYARAAFVREHWSRSSQVAHVAMLMDDLVAVSSRRDDAYPFRVTRG